MIPSFFWKVLALISLATPSPAPDTVDCSQVCNQKAPTYSKARCHSCRCKDALDGWLPSRKELTCGVGEEVKIFRSNPKRPEDLEVVTTQVPHCHNPSLFGGSCMPGSRLGQLNRGDIYFKWICRREQFRTNYLDSTLPYDKVAVIGTNARTGATCFWENSTGTLSDATFPTLDQVHSTPEELKNFSTQFPVNEGWACLYCHDNDPFLYSPYLRSTQWETGDYVFAPYARVLVHQKPTETTQWHLNASQADRCTSCHRISSGRTCKGFVQSSMGRDKDSGHEPFVTRALDQVKWSEGNKTVSPGEHWQLAYWMPLGSSHRSWKQWHQRYGQAKETVLQCCTEIGKGIKSAKCDWQPIPGHSP